MKQTDIQLRLYKAILIVGAILSVICIIGNSISDFPFEANTKWVILFFVAAVAYIFSNNKRYSGHIMFGVFVFAIFIFLPFAFIDSGGSCNNAIGYTFFLLVTATYLFNGWRRLFLVFALIAVFIVMHAVEYFYPETVAVYSEWTQFVDRIIQIPLLLLATFLIVLRFAREYEKVNRKLQIYASFDELTGLYNRRMFNEAMEEAVKNRNKPVHLALLDLDNFKRVNDKYGHCTGDEVLKELSFQADKPKNQRGIVMPESGVIAKKQQILSAAALFF